MHQITPQELKKKLDSEEGKHIVLIDVRERWEHEAYSIGGTNIPMGELVSRVQEIPKDKDVVMYCEKGIRSVIAVQRLESFGFDRLINLSGGMSAWRASRL
jgi:rhodanese-related sulfurtransferase